MSFLTRLVTYLTDKGDEASFRKRFWQFDTDADLDARIRAVDDLPAGTCVEFNFRFDGDIERLQAARARVEAEDNAKAVSVLDRLRTIADKT